MPLHRPRLTPREELALAARDVLAEVWRAALATSGTTVTTQRLWGGLIGLRAGDVVTNGLCYVSTAGVGTAPTLIKMGLYDTSGNRLAQSANVASDAMWTSTGYKEVPLSAAYTVTADGGYYVAILQDGAFASTALQIGRSNSINSAALAVSGGVRPYVEQSGQTDFPNPATFGNGSTAVWLGVN